MFSIHTIVFVLFSKCSSTFQRFGVDIGVFVVGVWITNLRLCHDDQYVVVSETPCFLSTFQHEPAVVPTYAPQTALSKSIVFGVIKWCFSVDGRAERRNNLAFFQMNIYEMRLDIGHFLSFTALIFEMHAAFLYI